MVPPRIWIMDGHNMIFAIPALDSRQVAGNGNAARKELVDMLREFGRTRGERVLVVFDGNDQQRNPGAIREPLFDAIYARRGDGEADDRIIHEARSFWEQGNRVTVVTNDVSTLAGELPEGVQRLGVETFWRKHITGTTSHGHGPVAGAFAEIERAMEAAAAKAVPESLDHTLAPSREPGGLHPGATSVPPGQAGRRPVPSCDSEARGRSPEQNAISERTRAKKEKGRLRHERVLRRRKSGRR